MNRIALILPSLLITACLQKSGDLEDISEIDDVAVAEQAQPLGATTAPVDGATRDERATAELEDTLAPAPDPVVATAGATRKTAEVAAPSAQPAAARTRTASPAKVKRESRRDADEPTDSADLTVASHAGEVIGGGGMASGLGGLSANGIVAMDELGYNAPVPEEVDVRANSDQFTDHGVNPFTMVSDDHLSTFSIDVDTASWSVSRRMLNEGSLPPVAAVRAEEFINYFDYDYVTPQDDPFAVNMEAMPDPFRPGHHILRVGVQGKDVSRDERPPLHLSFLVDVSGSMSSQDKLPLAKESLHMLVDGLREDDTVALATYAGRTARVLAPTSAANKRQIHDAIERLSSGGSTAMSAGIDIAYAMANESFVPGTENRVVILSDGDANVGRTSWDAMLDQIKGYADKGITVSTIGFGMGNYKDTLMEQLADKGDGNNYYIDSAAQAQRVFVDELGGTLVTIARDVKIQVDFNPESVVAYRLIGYENRDIADKDFRNDRVDAGEVGAGHNVTALYDVVLKEGYSRKLATVRMRYERPGPDGVATEKLWNFKSSRLAETPWQASRDTRIAYTAGTFGEILRASPNAAEISLAELTRFAEQSKRPGQKDDAELIALMKKAARLGAGDARNIATR